MNLEIERKFILKALPTIEPDDRLSIDQYYWKNSGGIWERVRTYHSDKYGDKWVHTIKKSVSKGVNLEEERDLTYQEFEDFKSKCLSNDDSKFINKVRYIYKDGDLKWEVDLFDNGYKLIIAEIEVPKKRYKLNIPDFIKDVLLLEVTGLKQFSNRNLSLNIKEINKYK